MCFNLVGAQKNPFRESLLWMTFHPLCMYVWIFGDWIVKCDAPTNMIDPICLREEWLIGNDKKDHTFVHIITFKF